MTNPDHSSPSRSADDYRAVGRVVGVHGLQGTLKVAPLSDFEERFAALSRVYFLRDGDIIAEYEVKKLRWGAQNLLISFRDLDSRDTAERLSGCDVCVPDSETWALPPNTYYSSDLLGFRAFGAGSENLGTLVSIRDGAQAILEFWGERGELLVPFVGEWVGNIDVAARTIEILNWQQLMAPDELPAEPGDHDH